MSTRTSRYEPRSYEPKNYEPRNDDPKYDDPYGPRTAYPDMNSGVGSDAYEYVGADAIPDPPAHTFDDHGSDPPRRRSSPHRRSNRASTQPPRSSAYSPPPDARRRHSPPVGASRHSDSPRHPRRSRRDDSPPPRSPKDNRPPKDVRTSRAPAGLAGLGAAALPIRDKYGQFMKGPALKNMKQYGRKGLHTLGDLADAYAEAQGAPPRPAPPTASRGRGRSRDYDDYYDDPYDRPPRRRRHSLSPSPPPTSHKAAGRESERRRPPLNGRQKSYSMSPGPMRKHADDESDRDHRRRSHRRHSPSPSRSPPRRSNRSYSRGRDKAPPASTSKRHASLSHYKDAMRSPKPDVAHRWQFAARAALQAGGMTAFQLRKDPGSWTGPKGAKVVTAALGAAAIDAFVDKDPRRAKSGGVKGMAESAIGGLLAGKLVGVPSATNHKGRPRF